MAYAYCYSVTIRPERKKTEFRLLGDCTGTDGLWLGDFIRNALATIAPDLPDLDDDDDDAASQLTATTTFEAELGLSGDRVGAAFTIAEYGSKSELVLEALGPDPVAKGENDPQRQRAGVLLALPRGSKSGVALFHHVDGRRSALAAVRKAVRKAVPDHIVEIKPLVDAEAFYAAVQADRVLEVALVEAVDRSERFRARANNGNANQQTHRVLVRQVIKAEGGSTFSLRGLRLLARRIRLGKSTTLQLGSHVYEEISVRVRYENGMERTHTLGPATKGWPLRVTLPLVATEHDDARGSSPAALANGLVEALAEIDV